MATTNGASTAPSDLHIPLVDISSLSSNDPTACSSCAASILSAFSRSGFLYLSHHPIPAEVIASVFAHSASFFARPSSQKDSLAWTSPAANRGYVRPGREKVSQGKTTGEVAADRAKGGEDLKESMEIGRDDEEAHPNLWPDQFDGQGAEFRRVMTDFFALCKDLHRLLMRAIALGLGLEETHFDGYLQKGDNTLRLLHYPSVSADVFRQNPGQVRAGAHTDYGSITLLFQDDQGGLEVLAGEEGVEGQSEGRQGTQHGTHAKPSSERWLSVKPIPGTIVVNAGDLLSLWSGGRIRSTKHRVVEPRRSDPVVEAQLAAEAAAAANADDMQEAAAIRKDAEHPARHSVAYFCNPDFDKWIEAIPGTYEVGQKKFEGCYSGRYLEERLGATYA